MKKYVSTLFVLLFVCSLTAEVSHNNFDSIKDTSTFGDKCSVRVSVDCDGDGQDEVSLLVDCEHVDATVAMLEGYCQ